MGYGKRICIMCQAEFEAEHSSQVCCSDTCRVARKRQTDSKSKKRVHEKNMALQIIVSQQEAMISDYQRQIETLTATGANVAPDAGSPVDAGEYEKKIAALEEDLANSRKEFADLEQRYTKVMAHVDKQEKTIAGLQTTIKNMQRSKAATGVKKPAAPITDEDLKKVDAAKELLKHCERLKLDAIHLPCGQREECWEGVEPCWKTTGMKKPQFSKKTIDDKVAPIEDFE